MKRKSELQGNQRIMNIKLHQDFAPLTKSRPKMTKWQKYLLAGLFSNAVVWGLVLAYLEFWPPTYTSKWALMVLGPDAEVQLSLTGVGQATPTQIDRPDSYEDPREDYVYIVESPAVLDQAAKLMDMSVDDFGEPEITTDERSALITFEVEGETPEQAQQKSQFLYQLLSKEIDRLRQAELERRQKETELTLATARQKLNDAQKKLATYQTQSSFSSEAQIDNLSVNIEQLRRQHAELVAEEKGVNQRLQQLSKDVDLSDDRANDAYILQADDVYQQQFDQYAQLSKEFAELSSQLGSQHPEVVEKKAELEGTLNILMERASFLLAKPVSQETLVSLTSLTLDPKVVVVRQDLFKDVVSTRADKQAIAVQKQELEGQIAILEGLLDELNQKRLISQNLELDFQLAEAVFTATLAKLDLGHGEIYSIYPPIQLVAEPSLPDEDDPTYPDTEIGLLGGAAGSFLVTTGLILLWWERNSPWRDTKNLINQEEEK